MGQQQQHDRQQRQQRFVEPLRCHECVPKVKPPPAAARLYGTAVACFILAIPNRYLPILQEGKIESFRKAK